MPAILRSCPKKGVVSEVDEHHDSTRRPEQLTSPVHKRPFAPRFSHPAPSSPFTQRLIGELETLRLHDEEEAKKSVKFDCTIHVILIPCREEYKEARLTYRLWYSAKEIARMEKESIVSVSLGHLSESENEKEGEEEDDEDYGDVTHLTPW